jgi:ribonuclease-3
VQFLRKLFGLERPAAPAPRGKDRDFDLRGLERCVHYKFKDAALARLAMTHRSYLHAAPGRGGESNERLEFLGDSVVGLVVNEFLYKKFTKLREGEMTKMKSLLVSRVILSRVASQMGLGHYILLSEAERGSGGRNRASILADTLEGVIGAIYLDGGLEPARQLTARLLLKEVHTILSDADLANYKSMLQEFVQGEFKSHPQYRISSENGPDHQKLFTVEVVVSGKTIGRGHGKNKKEAEQEAARDALLHFEKATGRPERRAAPPRAGRNGREVREGREGRERHGSERGEPRPTRSAEAPEGAEAASDRIDRERGTDRDGRRRRRRGGRGRRGGKSRGEGRPEGSPSGAESSGGGGESNEPPVGSSSLHGER